MLALLALLGFVSLLGLMSAWAMEHYGHTITGMTNHVVWGLPHVFAVLLIVCASGALNVASLSSVFSKAEYKPLAPLSGTLSVSLLLGGLAVLVLDLGRPDRLVVAMTHYNFKSIFTWNVFLYLSFILVVMSYLHALLKPGVDYGKKILGWIAFVLRIVLTTGTGSIFGFLVARDAFSSPFWGPMFLVFSFSYGLAAFILSSSLALRLRGCAYDEPMNERLARLMTLFVMSSFYFLLVFYVTNLYFSKNSEYTLFILGFSSLYSNVFWILQVLVGIVIPLTILNFSRNNCYRRLILSSIFVLVGGFSQMYVSIISSQAFPVALFPGYTISSSFQDGQVVDYLPSYYEWIFGFGGVALGLFVFFLALRLFPILPKPTEGLVRSTSCVRGEIFDV
jgi:Ni/Fe-hydrogenase subunit HybB-like protein